MPHVSSDCVEYGIQESTGQFESVGGKCVQVQNDSQVPLLNEPLQYQHIMKYYWYKYLSCQESQPHELTKAKEKGIQMAEIVALHDDYRCPNQNERRHVISSWLPKIISCFSDKMKARNLYRQKNKPDWWPNPIEFCSVTNNKKESEGRHTKQELEAILQSMRPVIQNVLRQEIDRLTPADHYAWECSLFPPDMAQQISNKVDITTALVIVKEEIKEDDEQLSISYQDSQPHTHAADTLVPGHQAYLALNHTGFQIKTECTEHMNEAIAEEKYKQAISSFMMSEQVEALSNLGQSFQAVSSENRPTVVSEYDENVSDVIAKSAQQNPELSLPQAAVDQLMAILQNNRSNPVSSQILQQVEFRNVQEEVACEDDAEYKAKLCDEISNELVDDQIKHSKMFDLNAQIFSTATVMPILQTGEEDQEMIMDTDDTSQFTAPLTSNTKMTNHTVMPFYQYMDHAGMSVAQQDVGGLARNLSDFNPSVHSWNTQMDVDNNISLPLAEPDCDLLAFQPDFEDLVQLELADQIC